MMKKILIIEDNKEEIKVLGKLVRNVDADAAVYLTDNVGDAYTITMDQDIDLFIVDIILRPEIQGDVSGMDFVDMVRHLPRYEFVPVIFMSGIEDPMMYAYQELHCYRYIQKPLHYKEVEDTVRQALRYCNGNTKDDKIRFQQDKIIYSIPKRHIIYLESHGGKMIIRTIKEEIVLFYSSCRKIMDKLKSTKFIKCSRSIVVNKDYIASVDIKNNKITLVDGYGQLAIGSKMKEQFLKLYCDYIYESKRIIKN